MLLSPDLTSGVGADFHSHRMSLIQQSMGKNLRASKPSSAVCHCHCRVVLFSINLMFRQPRLESVQAVVSTDRTLEQAHNLKSSVQTAIVATALVEMGAAAGVGAAALSASTLDLTGVCFPNFVC